MTTSVALAGASGKLGRLIASIIDEHPDFTLEATLGSSSDLNEMNGVDVVVDVTNPKASYDIVTHAVAHGARVLVGTSGWSSERIAQLESHMAASEESTAGVLIIPNFSLGSVLGTTLSTIAARFFDSIEIVEAHRSSKVDSPSGTAVRTAELIGKARAGLGPVEAPHVDQRARGQQVSSIPVHSLRLRGLIAQQDVILGGSGETLTISHETFDNSAYVSGIRLALEHVRTASGVTVGLENVIDLGVTLP